VQKINFHSFGMGDVEDPELYAAQPLYEWQQTEQGQWVMEHCSDPRYIVRPDDHNWGHKSIVYGAEPPNRLETLFDDLKIDF
jgi:hypothetical protein